MEKPSLASPLDAHLPSAVVGTILMRYLTPDAWAICRVTARGWEVPAFAAMLHPWRSRAAELQKLVHAPSPPPASLAETLALLQHCSLADDNSSVGVGVIPLLAVGARPARHVELRCPQRSWRAWMPLGLRFGAGVDVAREVRRVAPIPPVCELVARDPESVGALSALADELDRTGACGVVATATCDLLLVPRKAVLKWLDDCLAVEARHAEGLDPQKAAARRLAALPPRGAAKDDASTLWAVVVPRRPAAGDEPAAQLEGLLRMARGFRRAAG